MASLDKYKAYVLSIEQIDSIMKASCGVKDMIRWTNNGFDYHIRFTNESDLKQFQTNMSGYNVLPLISAIYIPEETAVQILTEQLNIGPILYTFVHNGDQIILTK